MAYKCIKCGKSTSSDHKPVNGICSKGGNHRWVNNNNKTSRRWQCSKCGHGTTCVGHPLVGVCSKGGGHSWHLY